jgi:prepilin-type N-terminal cleavage/methylation domain-containing protein
MKKRHLHTQKNGKWNGFSLTEAIVTSAIIGTLGSIAYPNLINGSDSAKLADAKASLLSIPPIIGAYIDATGEAPTNWEDLSGIAAVMTNNGPATGDLGTPIILPNSIYDLSIAGPTESVYTMTATRVIDKDKDEGDVDEEEYKYAIKSCFNINNGASDIRSGNLSEIADTLNCG